MIDNFDKFPRERKDWEFYFVQILDRNRSASSNNGRCIKSYFIDSQEYLEKRKDDMVKLADCFDARIYIHPARRNKFNVWLDMLWYTADCIKTGSTERLRRAYETACWKNKWVEKIWIVDVDTKDKEILYSTAQAIAYCRPYREPYVIMPTVNWYHMLYKWWFDTEVYNKWLEWSRYKRDIHKNNPTVLYAPDGS
jgi:hypothetical protein